MGEEKSTNFTPRILSYKKFAYREGNENDTKFMCQNGIVKVSRKVRFFVGYFCRYIFKKLDSMRYLSINKNDILLYLGM